MSLQFRHECIDPHPPGSEHDITLLGDLTGNGLLDIIIGGKRGEFNLFWYEAPDWKLHIIAHAPNLEAGGVLFDLNGDGRLDIIAGQQWGGNELYWFEQPPDPREQWTKRLIENRFEKYHDQAIGDIDCDDDPELIIVSQRSRVLAYYDLPLDPTQEPWPPECCHVIAEGIEDTEGLAICDIDSDGRNELIAGPSIYRLSNCATGEWRVMHFAPDYRQTRVAVGDLTGDGLLDIVLAEGESDLGRLAICSAPDYSPRVLRKDLFHPHSLAIADFDNDGNLDIFVGEMGLGRNPDPKLFIYRNLGSGKFEEELICRGIPTHEAKVADLNGDGKPDIVGKPYHPEGHIDVWWNEA
ncbi:MAG: FG-GAP repeat domain-containing protein [Candidatus Zipacnadales bacterium]